MRRATGLCVLVFSVAAFVGCDTRGGGERPSNRATDRELRIVTLAPHLAELVFAVGAEDALVGVSSYTNYPPEATTLPIVGDAFSVDQERLVLLKPTLLLAWASGTPARVVDELRARGFRVETIETRGLEDIADAMEQIGKLTARTRQGSAAANEFRSGLRQLANHHGHPQPISVFYQVSNSPLYTVNGDHYVSELIDLCGGRNIFSDLTMLAPLVDVEAVLARDPEVMLASSDSPDDAFVVWQRWPQLAANEYHNYFLLPADEIGRATPRLLTAGATLCETLDEARRNREAERDSDHS